ncbi:MAG: hypothetical protein ACKVOP_11275 [Sphingomonadaceae bacterium]
MTDPSIEKTAAAPRPSRRKALVAKASEGLKVGTKAARRRAAALADQSTDAVEAHPFATLAGAVALGAVIGALLPATDEEMRIAGPVGERLRQAADTAAKAAQSAGIAHLTNSGLTSAALSSGVGGILGAVIKGILAAREQAQATANATPGA